MTIEPPELRLLLPLLLVLKFGAIELSARGGSRRIIGWGMDFAMLVGTMVVAWVGRVPARVSCGLWVTSFAIARPIF